MRAEWVLVLAVNIVVLSCPQALGQQACKPTMTFIEARYSAMQLPKLQRTWTAVLSVDASQCQTLSGRFEIVYSMEKESAPDYEVREQLTCVPGSMKVSKEFWIDEAVAASITLGHALAKIASGRPSFASETTTTPWMVGNCRSFQLLGRLTLTFEANDRSEPGNRPDFT
jgi:hypothetical protein